MARKMKKMQKIVRDTRTYEEAVIDRKLRNEEMLKAAAAPTFLYAEIKKSSKYFGQMTGKFQVCVKPGEYCLAGGIGGQYRASDVILFAQVGDVFVRLTSE